MKGVGAMLDLAVTILVGAAMFWVMIPLIWQEVGLWGTLIALIIFPAAFAVGPIWELYSTGNWIPIIVCYGGIALVMVIRRYAGSWQET